MNDALIQLKDVWFGYNSHMILQGIDLSVTKGDFIAMVGPNGGGKTTLLKLILGLFKPQRGSVKVKGESPEKVSSCIGYVPQNVHLNPNFPVSVLDVVLMGKLSGKNLLGRITRQDRKQALETLARLNMEDLAERRIGDLSGGQKQRVFIARSLVTNPEILLLDEPTASIDSKGQNDFLQLLNDINENVTIVMVSHDLFSMSSYVKSVACVNKRLHYHMPATDPLETERAAYRCTVEETCPVEVLNMGTINQEVTE